MLDGISSRSGEGAGGWSSRALLDVWRSDSRRRFDDTGAASGSHRRHGRGVRFAAASAWAVRADATEDSDACGKPACHAYLECAGNAAFEPADDAAVDTARTDTSASGRDTSAAASNSAGSGSPHRSAAEGSNPSSSCSASGNAASADARFSVDSSRRSACRFCSACDTATSAAGCCSRSTRDPRSGCVRHFRTPADQPVPRP